MPGDRNGAPGILSFDHEVDIKTAADYFPDDMERQTFYTPTERGFEREVAKRLAYWRKLREGDG